MSKFQSWLLAFRPKTLTAAVVPIVVGTAYVKSTGGIIQWWIPGLALLASLFIQIGTNLVNDAVDFKKGADKEDRIGPDRVTQKGIFTSSQVMVAAAFCFFLASLCGIPLVVEGGLPIFLIGLASVAMGYSYTAGPFPLAYLGLGDLFVILFFGLVAISGLNFLMTKVWSFESFWLGLQVGLLCTVLIAINNFRDMKTDSQVGKQTLPVRFGMRFARYEIALLVFLPFVMNIYWSHQRCWWVGLVPALILPLGIWLVKQVFVTEPSPAYNQFLAKASLLYIGFGALLSLGLALC